MIYDNFNLLSLNNSVYDLIDWLISTQMGTIFCKIDLLNVYARWKTFSIQYRIHK